MSEQQHDWGTLTDVEPAELDERIYRYDTAEDGRVHIKPWCIDIGPQGWKIDSFTELLKTHFSRYVLPEEVHSEHEYNPMNKAREVAAPNIDFRSGGIISEFLLYLFTEGYLNMPQVSYRLYRLDDANQEVKGSDGLFVGRFRNNEVLSIGEAKFTRSIERAIEKAASSIDDFHGPGASEETRRELRLASDNIGDLNINGDELKEISNRLSRSSFENYRVFHPIFIGYQTRQLKWMPEGLPDDDLDQGRDAPSVTSQMQSKLQRYFDETDYFEKIDKKWPNIRKKTGTAMLCFIFFPVPNTTKFKTEMYRSMFFPERDELSKRQLLDFVGFDDSETIIEALEPEDAELDRADLLEILGSENPVKVLEELDQDVSAAVKKEVAELLGIENPERFVASSEAE